MISGVQLTVKRQAQILYRVTEVINYIVGCVSTNYLISYTGVTMVVFSYQNNSHVVGLVYIMAPIHTSTSFSVCEICYSSWYIFPPPCRVELGSTLTNPRRLWLWMETFSWRVRFCKHRISESSKISDRSDLITWVRSYLQRKKNLSNFNVNVV